MMFVNENDWEDQHVDLADEKWTEIAPGVERFRLPGNEPVRQIITGRRNHKVGAFYSWKNCEHVAHESDGEERCARLFDVHRSVRAFYGQPETLRIAVEGEKRPLRYTPDFLVRFGNAVVRIEYKFESELKPSVPLDEDDERAWQIWDSAQKMRRRLRLAADAYQRAGLVWILLTDKRLNATADPDTVDEIVANGGRPLHAQAIERLLQHLDRSPEQQASLAVCEEIIAPFSEFPHGDLLARIQERLIAIDLSLPITPETLVHLIRD